jgi:hypothetical protein
VEVDWKRGSESDSESLRRAGDRKQASLPCEGLALGPRPGNGPSAGFFPYAREGGTVRSMD